MITYDISPDGSTIRCGVCGLRSHNLNDVSAKYCAGCHSFHEHLKIPFQSEIEEAIKLMTAEMEEDPPDEQIWPRMMAFGGPEKKVLLAAIDPAMMADWRDKNKIGALIVKECFRHAVTVFLSDGYGTDVSSGNIPRNFADLPPSLRSEALLIFVNALGSKGRLIQFDYRRAFDYRAPACKGRRVFAPEPILRHVSSGRFLYDLREATELSATLDALFRGREGDLRAQG